jgi:NADPH:quinone reductase-like Zn-dependent oxidoreductase
MAKGQNPIITALMNAVRLHTPGGTAALAYEQLAISQPGPGEVLVRIHAAAITRDELEWPVDRLPATPSYEFSGVVAAVGSGVKEVAIGQAVYALSAFDRDGAAAEYALVSSEFVAPKPRNQSHVACAAIPLAALSAWQGLFDHGQLQQGQQVLIHGATGGVGHFAVQLARHHGAHVIGTVSTRNVEAARKLGIDEVIDYTTTRFEDSTAPVDLVFDTAGGDRLLRSPSIIRPGGKLVSVASEPPREIAAARGVEAVYFVVVPNRTLLAEITNLVESGHLTPLIDAVYPLAQARAAFERSLSTHGPGKIVLRVVEE